MAITTEEQRKALEAKGWVVRIFKHYRSESLTSSHP